MIGSIKAAAKHALKLLGRVTFEANNRKVSVVGTDGVSRLKTVRES